jgi:branched-chain amino acid transport system permease protein
MSTLAPTERELRAAPERVIGGRVLRSLGWPGAWAAAAAALLLTASSVSLGQINELTTLFALVAIAQAWNILLMLHSSMSLLEAMALSAVAGGLLAAIFAPAVFRLRGPYFAVGTLGLALAIQAWMQNWSYSGGSQPLSLPFSGIPSQVGIYRIAVAIAALTMLVAWLVRHSEFGLRLMAVRDNERAARALGVDAFRVKTLTFVVSGALMALAGGLIAVQSSSIEPVSAFGPGFTIDAVVMTVVGGMGTLVGPVVGVLVVFYGIQRQFQSSADLSQLLTGVALLVIVVLWPQGLWGAACRLYRRALSGRRIGAIGSTDGMGV